MATANTLHIINYFTIDVSVSVSSEGFNCCDYPRPGDVVGTISPVKSKDLAFCRTDGHGCNGRQGQFDLSIQMPGASIVLPLDFDSNGNIELSGESPKGLSAYIKQIEGGSYDLALCPPVST